MNTITELVGRALWCLFLLPLLQSNPYAVSDQQGARDQHKKLVVLPLELRAGPPQQGHRRSLLDSSILSLGGSIHGQGYYYATLQLGTPPRPFQVIIDTGSTITYVPCSTCSHCGKHTDPYFDTSSSSSYELVPCKDHDQCFTKTCQGTSCSYTRHYAEDSISSGKMISDFLSLPNPSATSTERSNISQNSTAAISSTQYRIIFGCEARETGDIYSQKADGIMGIGRGAVSLPSQLAMQGVMADVFALCYGDFNGGGSLVLGEITPPDGVQYTRLLKRAMHPAYYQVELIATVVGGNKVGVSPRAYSTGYGAVFDSGTTFSYFPSSVFNEIKKAVVNQVHLSSVAGPDPRYEDLCYAGAGDESDLSKHFPDIVLEFKPLPGSPSAKLILHPMNYLFAHTRPGAYCLGIFDNGSTGTLLGGIVFRNKLVIYDRVQDRVGFADEDCNSFQPRVAAAPASNRRRAATQDSLPSNLTTHVSTTSMKQQVSTLIAPGQDMGEQSDSKSFLSPSTGSLALAGIFTLGIIVGGSVSLMILLAVRRLAASKFPCHSQEL